MCTSLLRAPQQIPQSECLNSRLHFSVQRLEVHSQGASWAGFWWGLSPSLALASHDHLCLHLQRDRHSGFSLFVRTTDLAQSIPSSQPHLTLPIPSRFYSQVQHCGCWGFIIWRTQTLSTEDRVQPCNTALSALPPRPSNVHPIPTSPKPYPTASSTPSPTLYPIIIRISWGLTVSAPLTWKATPRGSKTCFWVYLGGHGGVILGLYQISYLFPSHCSSVLLSSCHEIQSFPLLSSPALCLAESGLNPLKPEPSQTSPPLGYECWCCVLEATHHQLWSWKPGNTCVSGTWGRDRQGQELSSEREKLEKRVMEPSKSKSRVELGFTRGIDLLQNAWLYKGFIR